MHHSYDIAYQDEEAQKAIVVKMLTVGHGGGVLFMMLFPNDNT